MTLKLSSLSDLSRCLLIKLTLGEKKKNLYARRRGLRKRQHIAAACRNATVQTFYGRVPVVRLPGGLRVRPEMDPTSPFKFRRK